MSGHINSESSSPYSHLTLIVLNITNFIKVTLDIQMNHYITWSALFKIHAWIYQVLDHTIRTYSPSNLPLSDSDPNLWSRLGVIVLQWIYGTISIISVDLLNTILENDITLEIVWNDLRDIFF